MSLTELVKAMQQQAVEQRKKESEFLQIIAELSNTETAEAVKDMLAAKKHGYGFGGYSYQLSKLKTLLHSGIPAAEALIFTDSLYDAESIIRTYYEHIQFTEGDTR